MTTFSYIVKWLIFESRSGGRGEYPVILLQLRGRRRNFLFSDPLKDS